MGKIRIIISTLTLLQMAKKNALGSGKGMRCLTAAGSLLAMASGPAMAGEEPTPEEVLAALNAEVAITQTRVEEVCGLKARLVAETKTLRSGGKKPTTEQRTELVASIHGCSEAKADHAQAKAAASKEEADASFATLVKSMSETK